VKTARNAAVLAAVLAGALFTALPARAATRNYDYVKGLVDHPLRFFDLAEKLLNRLEKSGGRAERAEAMLARAYLLKVRGDIHKRSEPKERRYLYEGDTGSKRKGALQFIEEYEKAAGRNDGLRSKAISLKSAIQQEMSRVYQDLIRLLPEGDKLRKELIGKRVQMREKAVLGLRKAMQKAEEAYKGALKVWRDPGGGEKSGAELKKKKAYLAYLMASQRYVQAMVRSAGGLEKGSSDQKAFGKKVADLIKKWLKSQDERMYDPVPEDVQMWMRLQLGRAWVFAGDTDKATSEGFAEVRKIEPDRFLKGGRLWAWDVYLRSMMFEAMALFDKAESTKLRKDYEAARNAIGFQFGTHASGKMLGIRAMILKGRVLGRLKEHASATAELNRALEKIKDLEAQGNKNRESRHAPDLRWRALRAMSEIVLVMLQGGEVVDVSPEVLVEAGRSCYRQANFEAAANCFRQAVNVSRTLPFERRVAQNGEPTAWYYMGIAYFRLQNYLEAQLAYEGALKAFLKQNMPAKFRDDPKNKALIENLLENTLKLCAANGRRAATAEKLINPSKFNKDRFIEWIKWEVKLDPSKEKDLPYYLALAVKGEADGAAGQAVRIAREKGTTSQLAGDKRKEALELYGKAKKDFGALPPASTFYEEGVYMIGVCSYQSMSVLSHKSQSAQEKDQARKLAFEALGQFDAYEKYIKGNPPRVTTDIAARRRSELTAIRHRRTRHKSAIALYRPFIYFDLENYVKALEAAEKLRGTRLEAAQQRSLHRILFKCYAEIAQEQKTIEKIKSFLDKAQGEAEWFNKMAKTAKKKDERESLENSYDFYINKLATANGQVMRKLRSQYKEMGLSDVVAQKEHDIFQGRRANLVKTLTSKEKYKTIDGLGLVAKLFIELGNYGEACDAYEELLKKFDPPPNDDRMGKKDEQLISFEDLADRGALLNTPNIDGSNTAEMGRVRRNLNKIELYMKGRKKGTDKRGRTIKEIPRDYDKSVQLIETFLRDYPEYDSKKGKKAGTARIGMNALKDELLFRLKLLRAANGKTICRVKLGEKLLAQAADETSAAEKKKLKEDARKEFARGLESAEDALRYWPKDADVRYNKAVCLLHAGAKDKLSDAKEGFDDLRAGSRYGGEIFWKATRGAVRARIGLEEYDGARIILAKLLLTDPEGVKKGWQEVGKYVKEVEKKLNLAPGKFLGEKVNMEKFDYRPRSEMEMMVENKINLLIPDYLKNGKIDKETAKVRIEMLKELVDIFQNRRDVLKKCVDNPIDLVHKLANGHIRSLKKIGGKARGEQNDKRGPELVGEKKRGKGGAKKKDEGKADAGRLMPVLGGTC
jgi:hypothetical protein